MYRDFNVGGQIIQTVKYADDLVSMAKEETVLQDMIETGSCYGMEMNVEKTILMWSIVTTSVNIP